MKESSIVLFLVTDIHYILRSSEGGRSDLGRDTSPTPFLKVKLLVWSFGVPHQRLVSLPPKGRKDPVTGHFIFSHKDKYRNLSRVVYPFTHRTGKGRRPRH